MREPSAHHTHEHTSHVNGLKDLNSRCRLLSCKVVEVIKHENMQLAGTSAQCHGYTICSLFALEQHKWPGNHILALASLDEALTAFGGSW